MAAGALSSRKVSEDSLSGVVFIPAHHPCPGVVVLGGSDGRMKLEVAENLAQVGVAAFAFDYWPKASAPLSALPIECVERACRWLLAQSEVIGDRVGLLGQSKGAELAVLVASRYPALIGPLVAVAPSAVVWYGIDQSRVPPMLAESSWSHGGIPVPYMSKHETMPAVSDRGMALRPTFEARLEDLDAVASAAIPVEMATGPILLLSGGDDQMWPSARMARMIEDRMAAHDRAGEVRHVSYEQAGHSLLVSASATPLDPDGPSGMVFDLGGSEEVNAEACNQAGHRITEFFHTRLLTSGAN